MVIFPLAPDQTIAQMWSNGVRGGVRCRTWDSKVSGSNPHLGCCVSTQTQRVILLGLVYGYLGVNRHPTRCTSPISVVLWPRLVSSWGLQESDISATLWPRPWGSGWTVVFSARQHIICLARCYHPSVCLSVRPSHGWIIQKRLKLGLWNFHHMVTRNSDGFPRAGASKKSEVGKFSHFIALSVNNSKTVADTIND